VALEVHRMRRAARVTPPPGPPTEVPPPAPGVDR